MPLDPQIIAQAIVEENNIGAEMCENLERLLEMYKVCIVCIILDKIPTKVKIPTFMPLIMNKHQRIPKGQSKMDNPEKLTTRGTQDEEKQNKNTTQCVLETTIRKQTQIM